jgi:hypothetical protein
MVLWLDAAQKDSISDRNTLHPGDNSYTGEVAQWQDISGSSATHSFFATATSHPQWDFIQQAIRFSGADQFMFTADHRDINLSTISQRTITVAFKTDQDVNSQQVIYEEGGTVRGVNIYLHNGNLHCGFWNDTDDGDGVQPYVELTGGVVANQSYVVSFILDYSNFSGANGVDGTVKCLLNDTSLGEVATTSRLYAHSGDIGLGAVNQHTVFATGPNRSNTGYFFRGVIFEFLMYNALFVDRNMQRLHRILQAKWGF